ncbi:MAG: hypothetical protein CMD16_02090 [Flavobacteriales bacterium]|nr:hypothetical protein [Flavobacteriales bacterium]|tara:strand:- start:86194 stop:86886 length:693 start_codon:yes stop_codon:yes gene_type:complete
MKNCIAFLFIISQVFIMHAQSLVVTGDAVVYGDPSIDIASYLTVKNVSSQSLNVICEKNIISQPQGGANYFCWGGTCYGTATIISPDFTTIDAGQASTEFAGHFNAISGPANCTATVEYCFYPDTDNSDASCITVTYDGSGATSTTIKEGAIVMSEFYPNPSSGYTNINYSSAKNLDLNIIDILGNKVKNVHLNNQGSHKIYIGDLSKGVYFGNLMYHDKVISIKKLIVK